MTSSLQTIDFATLELVTGGADSSKAKTIGTVLGAATGAVVGSYVRPLGPRKGSALGAAVGAYVGGKIPGWADDFVQHLIPLSL